jgi:hypothetical protein
VAAQEFHNDNVLLARHVKAVRTPRETTPAVERLPDRQLGLVTVVVAIWAAWPAMTLAHPVRWWSVVLAASFLTHRA